ncbi:iota-crystallin-like isoform X2 [Salvelinus sp. IW2-2015]|uniref:iota-crystallin-like isoform X2 n=1 Tax=Salvelinus sp. IW2-2015 TaxID=2691554 RepID=UPI0038D36A79
MPVDLNGYWKMTSNNNFEEYMKALDVNVAIRKIANLLKTDKDISVDGDHMVIKTLSTFKNYNMDFHVDKEFEEDLSGVDDRKCMASSSSVDFIWQLATNFTVHYHHQLDWSVDLSSSFNH